MRRQLRLFLVALSFIFLGLLVWMPSSHVKADDDDRGSIVGTWILTVTLPGDPPFVEPELVAINPGGTLILTSSAFSAHSSGSPFFPPPFVTDDGDGYGAWKRLGHSNRFAATYKRFLFAGANTSEELFGPFFIGQQVGVTTVQAVVTLQHGEDGDTLAGQATFQGRNLRGEVVVAGSATFSGKRLEIEPLATP